MENDGTNCTNTVQQFLNAEFGDNADIHICGICKLVFVDINQFVEHKKQPCGGFFISSVKSLNQRVYGRSALLEDAESASCEIPETGKIQKTQVLCSNESLTELSHAGGSSKCEPETEESSCCLMEVNVIPETVNISLLPDADLEVISVSNENPQDEAPASSLTLAGCVSTSSTRPISKKRKSASKVGKLRKYTCDHPGCEYACAYPKDLMRHLRIHSGEQPFECTTCNKKFNRSDKLRLHMRSHTGEKPYHCDVCNYSTGDHSSLNKHLRIHTGEKPYRCQICPYASRNSSQLVVHLRTHTLDAPYSCKICQRTFKISTDLKRHEQLHTGEKPFKCEACDYKCAFKGNLKMHFRLMHSTENMQKCSQCDFATPSRRAIRHHLKSHKPKDISCPYPDCTHTAKSLHPLSMHVLTHHKEEPFMCVYCMYLTKRPGNVCKHVKRYYPNSTPENGSSEISVTVGQLRKTVDNAKDNSDTITTNHNEENANIEEETSTPRRRKCKPKKRLSKILKRAIVYKPLCVPHFECHLCPAAFVREDSLRSHLRQHQSRNETLVKMATDKPSEPDCSYNADTSGSSPPLISSDLHPALEAISDTKEQVIERALRQSGIFCLQQMQSSDNNAEDNESGQNLKDNPNDDKESQSIVHLTSIGYEKSQVLATTAALGSTLPVQVGVQEGESNLQPLCQTSQDDAGSLVYEVQHCFLVPFDSSVSDTTQYLVQSAPGGFVQILNSTPNASEITADKDSVVTKCHKSTAPCRRKSKNRPIMPKPRADVQYLAFDMS